MRAPELVLAIDAGTGSCRASLFDRAGTEIAFAQAGWSHAEDHAIAGARPFDTRANWALICGCVGRALAAAGARPAQVKAVASTSMRGGLVLFDAAGRETWACSNADARAADDAAMLVASGAAAEIQRRGGDWVAMTAPARLRWIAREAPAALDGARAGLINDWIVLRLSGELATDPSIGSSSGMFDLHARSWSSQTLEVAGIAADALPRIVPSGTIVGGVTAQAARETGLAAGTPVVVGGADTALGLVGMGIESGECAITGGTFWQQSLVTNVPLLDPEGRLRTLCHAVEGRWVTEGIGFYCGLVMRWFRDAFCDGEIARARELGVDAYALMEQLSASVGLGAGGVIGLFSDVMDARNWSHGPATFTGFDVERPERSGRAACIRAIQEGAAYVAAAHVHRLEALRGEPFERVTFAGGAAHGELWPRIVADVLGRDVVVPARKEAGSLGTATIAAAALDWEPLHRGGRGEGSGRGADLEHVIAPDPTTRAAYDEGYERWRAAYARQRVLSDDSVVPPMWRAPGVRPEPSLREGGSRCG